MNSTDENINLGVSDNISRYLLNTDDPEELTNFLKSEEEKRIYDLRIGDNQLTSKFSIFIII